MAGALSAHRVVKKANATSISDIQQLVPAEQLIKNKKYSFRVEDAKGLYQSTRDKIWSIFEQNMKETYETTDVFDWNPAEKQAEMFHELSRFLLVSAITPSDTESSNLLAYVVFRFEREDNRNIVYLYELQTAETGRRLGLGSAMVLNLDTIGRGVGMTAIMLTHFKVNNDAKIFYDSLGFEIDRTSPDYESDEEWVNEDSSAATCDYTILSRRIQAL